MYSKIQRWFDVIKRELDRTNVLPENVYNMDGIEVKLSMLGSMKVLIGKDDLQNYRGAGNKRTVVTVIECISADGRSLHQMITWPATTKRNTWKRDAKEAAAQGKKYGAKRKISRPAKAPAKRTRKREIEVAEGEIEEMGLGGHCTVLQF